MENLDKLNELPESIALSISTLEGNFQFFIDAFWVITITLLAFFANSLIALSVGG